MQSIGVTVGYTEAAKFLRVSEATVQELAKAGELPGAKIGREWVFLPDVLDQYLREQIEVQTRARRGEPDPFESKPPPPRTLPTRRAKRRGTPPPLPPLPEANSEV